MERFYDRKRVSHVIITDEFLKLPRKCQEMFFEYMENFQMSDGNPYRAFSLINFGYIENCHSPIEMIFAMAFDIVNYQYYGNVLTINPQEEIKIDVKKYVADFVFDTDGEFGQFYSSEHALKLVIECDGHEYHKISKKQVKYDNERDLDLKMNGYEVLHFSGSQIYQNPWKCAEDAIKYILSRIGKISKGGSVDEWMDKTTQEDA